MREWNAYVGLESTVKNMMTRWTVCFDGFCDDVDDYDDDDDDASLLTSMMTFSAFELLASFRTTPSGNGIGFNLSKLQRLNNHFFCLHHNLTKLWSCCHHHHHQIIDARFNSSWATTHGFPTCSVSISITLRMRFGWLPNILPIWAYDHNCPYCPPSKCPSDGQ